MPQHDPRLGVSLEEYRQMRAASMTERTLQNVIIAAAKRHGWLVYHTFDSRRSEPGYPDLTLVHPRLGVHAYRELKQQKGRVTPEQRRWLTALTAAGVDAAVWRPWDWVTDAIPEWLANPTHNNERNDQ